MNASFLGPNRLADSEEREIVDQFECTNCPTTFPNAVNRNWHERIVHNYDRCYLESNQKQKATRGKKLPLDQQSELEDEQPLAEDHPPRIRVQPRNWPRRSAHDPNRVNSDAMEAEGRKWSVDFFRKNLPTCRFCSKTFDTSAEWQQHEASAHPYPYRYFCRELPCSERFHTVTDRNRHEKDDHVHRGENAEEEDDPKATADSESSDTEARFVISPAADLRLPPSASASPRWSQLWQNRATWVRRGIEHPFHCTFCHRQYETADQRNEHEENKHKFERSEAERELKIEADYTLVYGQHSPPVSNWF